ncbi:hypothetical protein Bca52824_058612 [Brassica carinata]|uniref:Uncharacterized protein n=1 Tax=Brassica carinata TaxID=52824 RepID=A0A8X7QUA7_BRACI|nr:hypothetical protein Bca52824_058612 [Brassica carinata]
MSLLPTPHSLSLTLLSIMPPAKAATSHICWWNQELLSSISGTTAESVLHEVINRASDGGITPLHVAAL